MIKQLKKMFASLAARESSARGLKPNAQKRPTSVGDFRAVEIAPSVLCCEAAKKASGKRHLLRKAPRVPLMGCTMPLNCSCAFRKNADRRDGDRRLLGAGTSRWFAGVDSRKYGARRLSEL